MEERNVNEDLKEKDQMKWVQEMNSIKNTAEEIFSNKVLFYTKYNE